MKSNLKSIYEKDFYAWTNANALLMKEGKMNELDIENLIEEIESMGRSEKWELVSRLEILVLHLLKWQHQPNFRGRSWQLTIKEQRERINSHLEDNPSLKSRIQESLQKSYRVARIKAEKETGLNESTFPEQCPYDFKKIIDDEFYPE